MSIVALGRDDQVGIDDPAHAKYDAWIVFTDPRRVGEEDRVYVSDSMFVLLHNRRETLAAGLFLAFDEHDNIDVELASLLQGSGCTGNRKDRTFVVRNAAAVEISVCELSLVDNEPAHPFRPDNSQGLVSHSSSAAGCTS